MRTRPITLLLAVLAVFALPGLALAQDSGASVARGAASEVHEEVHPEEGEHGETHEEKTYFGIPAWILKLINLILFIGVLAYFIGRPVKNALADRREKIARELAEAGERRVKAERLASDIQARLDQIEKEVESIIQRAEEEGERQKKEIIEQGTAEAQKIVTQAQAAVAAQLKNAKQELTQYAGELASERALRLLQTEMTDADRKKIFAEGLEEIRS